MPDQAGELLEIQQRRKAVSERYIRGETQWQIARALEVGQATISRDLEAIRAEWLESSLVNFNERRAEEIAKLDALERECWLAWQRSCLPKKTSSNKRRASLSTDSKGGSSETFLREEMRDGNPRFLEAALKCIEKRCLLLGLEKKADQVFNVVTAAKVNLDSLPLEDRLKLLELRRKLEAGPPPALSISHVNSSNGNGKHP